MERPLMIVGGDEAVRVLDLLAADGYVTVHSTPSKMVAALARLKPKVLLFELAGESKGVEDLIQRIQATAYGAVVPIVFFGPPPGPNPAEVVVLGGDLYLPTPVDPVELRTCVNRLAGGPPSAVGPHVEPARTHATDAHPGPSAGPPSEAPGAAPPLQSGRSDPAPIRRARSKMPEPSEPGDLEELGRPPPIDLPWNDPDEGRPPKAPHSMDDQGTDLLKRAMDEDLFLDPREMALTITTMVPEMSEMSEAEDLLHPDVASSDSEQDSGEGPFASSGSGATSEVEAIVQEFIAPGGEGDTVAVRIRRTIDAFEERFIAPGLAEGDGGAELDGLSPPQHASSTLPGAPAMANEDEIDLDALDHVDASEEDYPEDPERVLQQLEDDLSTGDEGSEATAQPQVSSGGTEISRENRLPPEPTGEELPRASSPNDDAPPPFAPAPSDAYMEARDVPAPEGTPNPTVANRSAPLASPYDLPPVVSAQGFEYEKVPHGPGDVVDTVPGRRTAVHASPSGAGGSPQPSAGQGAAGDTQPAKRAASTRGPLPRQPSPLPETHQPGSRSSPGLQGVDPQDPPSRLREEGAEDTPTAQDDPTPGEVAPKDIPTELLEGSLREMDPARLIQAMASLGLSGALEIDHPEGRYELHIHRGRLRLALSSRIEESMLEMLRRQSRITDEQRSQVAQELTSGRRAGAVLLDRGWIKPAELIPTVRQHLENLVYAVFALEDGRYRFDAGRPLPEEIVYLERPTAALVLEGVRRKYTAARVQRLVGSAQIAPVKLPEADESILAGSNLSGRDWRIIDAMDGRRTVDEISTELGVDPQDLWTLAWGLASLGLVKLHRPEAKLEARSTERLPSPRDLSAENQPLDAPMAAPSLGRRDPAQSPSSSSEPTSLGPTTAGASPQDLDMDVERVLSRHRLVREGDYFACLGVAPDASPHELRRAYDQALSLFDPDKLHPAVRTRYSQELEEILEVIHEAYSVLSDEPLREAYRARLTASISSGEEK